MYKACDAALRPRGLSYSPGEWWRALLTTLYLTGWRIGETMALRRDDLNLAGGLVKLRAETTTAKWEERIALHPLVLDHLERIASFAPAVFPWNIDGRGLYVELGRIQGAAAVEDENGDEAPVRREDDRPYGFHDFRRRFATMNAANMTADALQKLMRHTDYQSTQRYINMAGQLTAAVANIFVPDCLRDGSGGIEVARGKAAVG